jgi:hypothetical protein
MRRVCVVNSTRPKSQYTKVPVVSVFLLGLPCCDGNKRQTYNISNHCQQLLTKRPAKRTIMHQAATWSKAFLSDFRETDREPPEQDH